MGCRESRHIDSGADGAGEQPSITPFFGGLWLRLDRPDTSSFYPYPMTSCPMGLQHDIDVSVKVELLSRRSQPVHLDVVESRRPYV